MLDRARRDVRGRLPAVRKGRVEVERRAVAVVVARARGAERDLVAVPQHHLATDALAVDVRAVEAPEVAQNDAAVALLEDAVLLRDNLVEELDRVVRMPAEAVDGAQLDRLLSLRGREDQTRHPIRIVPRRT